MNISMAWHSNDCENEFWSTPKGISIAFKKLGHTVYEYGYNPDNCNLQALIDNSANCNFIVVWTCGPHLSVDNEIRRVKSMVNKKIIMELGDEPQTYHMNQSRVDIPDAIFTPDKNCHNTYKTRGLNSYWLNHWGDEFLFEYDETISRENKCITTCGDRHPTSFLKAHLGDLFINERVPESHNHAFYNSGTICLQSARHNEITRRIMEAGGCKLAVITNRIPASTGIYDLFKEGEDILYYSDEREALEHVELLLNDENLRNKLANNIYDKINRYHRAATRCNDIINIYDDFVT